MDFGLSEEQREFKTLCRGFATEVIRPVAAQHDADESTPWEVIKAAHERGLQGIDHLQRLASDPDGQFSVIRGAALGLRRDRAGALRLIARGGGPRRLRHAGADREVGSRVLRLGR